MTRWRVVSGERLVRVGVRSTVLCQDGGVPIEVFVDESERSQYLLVSVAVDSRALATVRSAMRGLLLPGERRIHFATEKVRRRRQLLDRIATMGPVSIPV